VTLDKSYKGVNLTSKVKLTWNEIVTIVLRANFRQKLVEQTKAKICDRDRRPILHIVSYIHFTSRNVSLLWYLYVCHTRCFNRHWR